MKKKLKAFLVDDAATRDITASLLPEERCRADIVIEEDAVVAGLEEAAFVFKVGGCRVKVLRKDGSRLKKMTKVLSVFGSNRKIVSAERTALNLLGRMSGVATNCAKAKRIAGNRVKIFLTRKTMPGFNLFDKKACTTVGVYPHRVDLSEMIILKPTHLRFFKSITEAVKKAQKKKSKAKIKKVEVEVGNLGEAIEAVEAGADWIMLDNFSAKNAKRAIREIRKRSNALIECSGGIDLNNLKEYVRLKPDIISMGALTKNAKWIDFGPNIHRVKR